MSITDRLETLIPKDGTFVSINAGSPNEQIVRDAIAHLEAKPVPGNSTEKLTGLAYLLEHAEFADKEAREKTEARIKQALNDVRNGAVRAAMAANPRDWCLSCGTVSGDGQCHCTDGDEIEECTRKAVNYFDEYYAEARKMTLELQKSLRPFGQAGSDIYWNDVPNERRLYLDGAELPFDMGDLRKAALSLGMEKG